MENEKEIVVMWISYGLTCIDRFLAQWRCSGIFKEFCSLNCLRLDTTPLIYFFVHVGMEIMYIEQNAFEKYSLYIYHNANSVQIKQPNNS